MSSIRSASSSASLSSMIELEYYFEGAHYDNESYETSISSVTSSPLSAKGGVAYAYSTPEEQSYLEHVLLSKDRAEAEEASPAARGEDWPNQSEATGMCRPGIGRQGGSAGPSRNEFADAAFGAAHGHAYATPIAPPRPLRRNATLSTSHSLPSLTQNIPADWGLIQLDSPLFDEGEDSDSSFESADAEAPKSNYFAPPSARPSMSHLTPQLPGSLASSVLKRSKSLLNIKPDYRTSGARSHTPTVPPIEEEDSEDISPVSSHFGKDISPVSSRSGKERESPLIGNVRRMISFKKRPVSQRSGSDSSTTTSVTVVSEQRQEHVTWTRTMSERGIVVILPKAVVKQQEIMFEWATSEAVFVSKLSHIIHGNPLLHSLFALHQRFSTSLNASVLENSLLQGTPMELRPFCNLMQTHLSNYAFSHKYRQYAEQLHAKRGQDDIDSLHLPLQRIMRYPLFIKNLLDISPSSPELARLMETVDTLIKAL